MEGYDVTSPSEPGGDMGSPHPPSDTSSPRPAPGPVSGPYSLSRGVRAAVGVSSAGLAAVGAALTVVGGLGGPSMEGFIGINAVVTGVTLLIAGVVGLVAIFMSRAAKVGRGMLLLLVTSCHASGAFAFQCVIIAGQKLAARQLCLTPDTVTMATSEPVASCDTMSFGSSISGSILALSLAGFVLGVVCSAFVYLAVPRLLCCLCDVNPPSSHYSEKPEAHRHGEDSLVTGPEIGQNRSSVLQQA